MVQNTVSNEDVKSNLDHQSPVMKVQRRVTNEESIAVSTARRRLSIDGLNVNLDGTEEEVIENIADMIPPSESPIAEEQFVNLFAGKSQKGYVPYNPRKVNQDYMLTREDPETKTLILGAFDGHGEHGHCISEV